MILCVLLQKLGKAFLIAHKVSKVVTEALGTSLLSLHKLCQNWDTMSSAVPGVEGA